MPENFEQMVATIKNYFSVIFSVLLGTTNLIIMMQFIFEKTALIVRKTEKYIFTASGLKIAQIEGRIASHQKITRVLTERAARYIDTNVLIWEMFTLHLSSTLLSKRSLKTETIPLKTRIFSSWQKYNFTTKLRSNYFPCAQWRIAPAFELWVV